MATNKKLTVEKKHSGDENDLPVENEGLQSTQLLKLFENSLKDIYWAEKALTKALPKMIKNATKDPHPNTSHHFSNL